MMSVNPGRPAADEYLDYYGRYIDLVPDGDIVATLERQMARTEATLATYTEAQAQWRPVPGEWNATEIVGHLSDAERVFVYRAMYFARDGGHALPGMEPDEFMRVAGFASRPLADVAAEYIAVRRASIPFFRSLDADAWRRSGSADGNPISVRALAYVIAGHELHHGADLEKYPSLAGRAA